MPIDPGQAVARGGVTLGSGEVSDRVHRRISARLLGLETERFQKGL